MADSLKPLFVANTPFTRRSQTEWQHYRGWAKIPALRDEVVTLDSILCPRFFEQFIDEDWRHIVNEDFRLDYCYDLDYLLSRVASISEKNILGVYRNPSQHISTPPAAGFVFFGYDLIEEQTQVSAITNCGGFPDTFSNSELNEYGLLQSFDRASEICSSLPQRNPDEPHAHCELYAIWRLSESSQE